MGPLRAIKTGLSRSFQFSGRASRSEFWYFAPLALIPPMLLAKFPPVGPLESNSHLAVYLFFICVAGLPLAAVATRRFHDTDAPGTDLWHGLKPAFISFCSAFMVLLGITGVASIYYVGLGLIMICIGLPLFLLNIVQAPGMLGMTIGQLILPSDRQPNRYGPVPV